MNIKGTVAQALSLNVLIWLTMLTLFAGLMACAASAYLAMAPVVTPALAALYTGLGLLVVFVLWLLVIQRILRTAPKPTVDTSESRDSGTLEHNLRPVLGDRATDWTRDNAGLAVVGALALGTVIAASPSTRRFVVRAAGPIFTRKLIRSVQDFTDN